MYNLLFSFVNLSEQLVTVLSSSLKSFYPVLYNGIGFISIFLQFMIFQMKSRKKIIFMVLLTSVGFLTYFVLQGDFISGVSNIISIISNLVFILRDKYLWANSVYIFLLFSAQRI